MDYLAPNSCAAQRPSRLAQPAGGPARLLLCRLRPRQREGSVPGACARHRATPPPSLPAWRPSRRPRCPGRRHAATPTPSHSPSPSFSPPALYLSHPRIIAAADEHHRSHRLPLASPTCSPDPPRPPLPPRRATQDGAPRGAVAVAKFASGRRGAMAGGEELTGAVAS